MDDLEDRDEQNVNESVTVVSVAEYMMKIVSYGLGVMVIVRDGIMRFVSE